MVTIVQQPDLGWRTFNFNSLSAGNRNHRDLRCRTSFPLVRQQQLLPRQQLQHLIRIWTVVVKHFRSRLDFRYSFRRQDLLRLEPWWWLRCRDLRDNRSYLQPFHRRLLLLACLLHRFHWVRHVLSLRQFDTLQHPSHWPRPHHSRFKDSLECLLRNLRKHLPSPLWS